MLNVGDFKHEEKGMGDKKKNFISVNVLSLVMFLLCVLLIFFTDHMTIGIVASVLWLLYTIFANNYVLSEKKEVSRRKTLKECNHKGRFNKEVAELEKQYDSIKSREEFMKTTPDSMQDLYDKILEQAESNLESAAAYMESYDYVTNPDPVYLKKLILEGDTLVQKFNNLLEKLVDVDTNPTDLDVKYIDDLTNCLAEMRENQKQTMTS